jgi:long-chain acyl-CoA synthetase
LMAKLTNIIIFEKEVSEEDKTLIEESGFTLHHWHQVIDKGREVALEPQEVKLPEADNCFMICYTSGTTGDPKGVMVTHKMIV